jgi:hypothetical protein
MTSRALIIIGDEAFTEAEFAAYRRKLEQQREYYQRPEVKARRAENHREWQRRNADKVRRYNREWTRRYRDDPQRLCRHLSDEQLASRIQYHQRLIDRYERALAVRAKRAA